ncbi:MAG: anti-sigma factor family protein [Gemmatimonas sp.]|jgi:anti-sigma factor RsiW|uniref:anti-sigma factor family protein n=1 Tax=Gemmatimonas sp. TaxID=1962908 RepID=UPI0025C31810|nr:zf-HC2 domain-containing protein [Gemmatimonas sp.]MCA2982336.1 zf-HC2 domain-containing protein [Gemmatimonas sp.]MCA2987345.1 zf-HC2 domain-containing protein [Gemmatimonas sp.]MCA2994734.1 zf-HC2 domain-containing protein [Gemmatimonas sp.]MCE2954446.1 zf-HC2 domain-containing protein [Gemmatimonas sp.]
MNDHGLDTIVAGVRCRDVLADLSDFLDGALGAPRVAELQGHLAACSNCARFGGHIARTLTALRRAMPEETRDQGPAVLARIRAGR